MPTVLVIDDEPSILRVFRRVFRDEDLTLLTASSGWEGLNLVTARHPDLVILDINLPDISGLEILQKIRQLDERILVVLITGFGGTDTAIEAMKYGAFEYLVKPLELAPLRQLIRRALEISRLAQVPAVLAGEAVPQPSADVLIGRTPAMQEVYKLIGRVAPLDETVLITGESGTGKELAARAIYHHSRRSTRPFLTINSAAIPETLLESELFGHEKGAFTGADRKRIGKFEQCTGGTIFLDEIGDMSPLTQAKILRVLQEQRFERVGGNETIETNVRLLAATNHDLEELVQGGRFRRDLYYRLSVFTVRLPPLRDRLDDLPLLVEYFLRRFSSKFGKAVYRASDEALESLRKYQWPGNIRELQSVLKQALLHGTGSVLLPAFLPSLEPHNGKKPETAFSSLSPDWEQFLSDRLEADSQNLYAEALALMERHVLTHVLMHTRGNQLHAARILGISRGLLRKKLHALEIRIERNITPPPDLPAS
jgi:DNA-binding NtrC family response regulator